MNHELSKSIIILEDISETFKGINAFSISNCIFISERFINGSLQGFPWGGESVRLWNHFSLGILLTCYFYFVFPTGFLCWSWWESLNCLLQFTHFTSNNLGLESRRKLKWSRKWTHLLKKLRHSPPTINKFRIIFA